MFRMYRVIFSMRTLRHSHVQRALGPPNLQKKCNLLSMKWLPYVLCPSCAPIPIRLPYSNPPSTGCNLPEWPKDKYQLNLICPKCVRPAIYQKDVALQENPFRWGSFLDGAAEQGKQSIFYRATVECGVENCTLQSLWHLPSSLSQTKEQIKTAVLGAIAETECDGGHSARGGKIIELEEVFEL